MAVRSQGQGTILSKLIIDFDNASCLAVLEIYAVDVVLGEYDNFSSISVDGQRLGRSTINLVILQFYRIEAAVCEYQSLFLLNKQEVSDSCVFRYLQLLDTFVIFKVPELHITLVVS